MRGLNNKKMLVLLILYLIGTIFFQMNDTELYTKWINPLFWSSLIICFVFLSHQSYHRFYRQKRFIQKMIIISLVYLLTMFYIGFITGFGKNPYSHTISGIIKNFFQLVIPIIGIELVRSDICNTNRQNKKVIVLVTCLLFLIEVEYAFIINNMSDKKLMFEYFCSTILPLLAGNFLFSYLTLLGSYKLSLIYRLADNLMILFFPIIPNMNWFATGSYKIISMAMIYILFRFRYCIDDSLETEKNTNNKNKFAYTLTLSFCILLILFMLGAFKYEPIAILSNSMVPTYSRGDVVIYEKLTTKELKKLQTGNIIIYKIGNVTVAHRIVQIIQNKDMILYETKGDNNHSNDLRLIEPSQILGVYIGSISYVGYPSVWLNEFFT